MNDTARAHLAAMRAHRQHVADHLDGQTAEIAQFLASDTDPYDDRDPQPGDTRSLRWFARSPGSPHWVLVEDLPPHTARLIRRRIEIEHLAERPRPLPSGGHWS